MVKFRCQETVGINALILANFAEKHGFYARLGISDDGLTWVLIHNPKARSRKKKSFVEKAWVKKR